MTPSKKGFAIVLNTQGAVAGASRQSYALMNMGMQAAKLRADRELQMQKMSMEVLTKDRNIDARGRADFDLVQNNELERLQGLAKSGELTVVEVSKSANRLNSLAETINGGYKLGDELVKNSEGRGYIPERVQEFNALALSRMNLDPESKARAYARINEVGAYTQMPFGSYMINESKVSQEFAKAYGVSVEDLRKGDYIAQTEVAKELFERSPDGGFRAKRVKNGLIGEEVFSEAMKNPALSRIADDAVTYEAYRRVSENFERQGRQLPADWEEVQRIGLYGYADDNPASSMFYKEVIAEREKLTPDEVYRAKNLRTAELLDNVATGKYNLTSVPEGLMTQSFQYTGGGIMFGTNSKKEVVSFPTNVVGGVQFMSVPAKTRKTPVPVRYNGEQYFILPNEWAVSGEQLKMRGGVMIKADGQSASSIATMISMLSDNQLSNSAAIQGALSQVSPGSPEGAEKQIKVVDIAPNQVFDGDEFAAVQLALGIGMDSRMIRTGSTINALRGHYNNANNSRPGVTKSKDTPSGSKSAFNVDNLEIED
jgi:hypothetical protein